MSFSLGPSSQPSGGQNGSLLLPLRMSDGEAMVLRIVQLLPDLLINAPVPQPALFATEL